jgi:hypothetical protein
VLYITRVLDTAGGHPTGVGADNGANLGERDISFTPQHHPVGPCE